jgi:hypothetical protein
LDYVSLIEGTEALAPETPAGASAAFAYAVECDQALLVELAARALEGLCRLRHGGLEIGGVLYGRREPGRIIVQTARELECDHALGPTFRLSAADQERLSALISAPGSDPELQGLETVGWYVSHTRSGLELTPHDVEIFSRYFADPAHFALVIKPFQFEPAVAGCFARSIDGQLRADAAFAEFRIERKPDDATPGESLEGGLEDSGVGIEIGDQESVAPAPRRKGHAVTAGLCLAAALVCAAVLGWLNISRPVAADQPRTTKAETSPMPPVTAPVVPESRPPEATAIQAKEAATPAPSQDRVKELERELAMLRARLNQPKLPPPSGVAERRTEATRRIDVSITPPPVQSVNPGEVSQIARQLNLPPQVVTPPAPAPPPPATPAPASVHPAAPAAPSAGRIIWTGLLRKGGVLFIEDNRCSSGVITGALPGAPVLIHTWPAELTDNGMIVYSNDPKRSGRSESPGANNGWNYTVYAYKPARAGDLRVLESPAAQNGWKKIVIRSETKSASLLVIDWEALPR